MPRPLSLEATIADHHVLSRVTAQCPACGHVAVLDTWALGVKLGWETPLTELEGRLRCTRCGARPCRIATSLRRSSRG